MTLFNVNLVQNDTGNIKLQLRDGDGVVDRSPFPIPFTMVNDARMGFFNDDMDAAMVYHRKAVELFCPFAIIKDN